MNTLIKQLVAGVLIIFVAAPIFLKLTMWQFSIIQKFFSLDIKGDNIQQSEMPFLLAILNALLIIGALIIWNMDLQYKKECNKEVAQLVQQKLERMKETIKKQEQTKAKQQ